MILSLASRASYSASLLLTLNPSLTAYSSIELSGFCSTIPALAMCMLDELST